MYGRYHPQLPPVQAPKQVDRMLTEAELIRKEAELKMREQLLS